MKRIKILAGTIASVMLLSACSDVIVYEPEAGEMELYSKVYIPRAERPVEVSAISTSGETQEFLYSAYLGGPKDASSAIDVTFAVDADKVSTYNEKNGTEYKLLPQESYTLEADKGVIPAGSRTTGNFKLSVKPGDYLTMFESYILPLSISQAGITVSKELETTYFVFTVTYEPGQVPREKVLSMGANWGNILSAGSRGSLMRRDTKNDILLYLPDAEGRFTVPPRVIGINWEASESFYYVNEKAVVVRNYPYWAGLFSFIIDDNYELPGANPFWLGDFWDKYVIVPYKDYFLTVDNEGVMRRQPVFTDVNAPKTQVGAGFKDYKQILAYQDYLLALDKDGKLWLYSMSADAVPGSKKQVGAGWDIYKQIVVSGEDILALDEAGDIYRYKFNPKGFYPLK